MFTIEKKGWLYHTETLYTYIYGAIYEYSYYAKYICFTLSLYHSSVTHKNVAFEVCRWSRIHSFLLKYLLSVCNQKSDH